MIHEVFKVCKERKESRPAYRRSPPDLFVESTNCTQFNNQLSKEKAICLSEVQNVISNKGKIYNL